MRVPCGWLLAERFYEIEYFLGMAGHLHAAPLAAQHASSVEHEGAALDSANLLAVHVFQFDHTEQPAGHLFCVAQEIEGQALLGFEVLVGFEAISGNAQDAATSGLEFCMQVTELLGFG